MYGEPAVKRVFSTYGPIGPSLKTEIDIEGAFYTGNGIVEYDVKYSKQMKITIFGLGLLNFIIFQNFTNPEITSSVKP